MYSPIVFQFQWKVNVRLIIILATNDFLLLVHEHGSLTKHQHLFKSVSENCFSREKCKLLSDVGGKCAQNDKSKIQTEKKHWKSWRWRKKKIFTQCMTSVYISLAKLEEYFWQILIYLTDYCSWVGVKKVGWANDVVMKKTLPISKSSSSVSISACGTAGGGWHFLSWNATWFIKNNKSNYICWINRNLTKSIPLMLCCCNA